MAFDEKWSQVEFQAMITGEYVVIPVHKPRPATKTGDRVKSQNTKTST